MKMHCNEEIPCQGAASARIPLTRIEACGLEKLGRKNRDKNHRDIG